MKKKRKQKSYVRLKIVFIYSLLIALLLGATFTLIRYQKIDTVKQITVQGNYQSYTEADIVNMSSVTKDTSFLLTRSSDVEKQLLDTGRFKSVKVGKEMYRAMTITVDEKRIVGQYIENNIPKHLLEDGMILPYNIHSSKVPFIDVSTIKGDHLALLTKSLGEIDATILSTFSDIVVTNAQETDYIYKITTTLGDVIYIREQSIVAKIKHYLVMDQIMNSKGIRSCEYHFEYNDRNVSVKELK